MTEPNNERQELTPGRPPRPDEELKNVTEGEKDAAKAAAVTTGIGLGCLGTIFSPLAAALIGMLLLAVAAVVYMFVRGS